MIAAGGNGPLESHSRANLARRRIRLIRDNPPSKQMCLGVGLIGCMPLKTLLCSSAATTLERFEGHTPHQSPQKTYPLAWGIVLGQYDALERDVGHPERL